MAERRPVRGCSSPESGAGSDNVSRRLHPDAGILLDTKSDTACAVPCNHRQPSSGGVAGCLASRLESRSRLLQMELATRGTKRKKNGVVYLFSFFAVQKKENR